MAYIIARTAKKNQDINGSTLYLTSNGLWSLDIKESMRFKVKSGADDYAHIAFEPDFTRTIEFDE